MQQFPGHHDDHQNHGQIDSDLAVAFQHIYADADDSCIVKVHRFVQWDQTHAHRKDLRLAAKHRNQRNNQQKCQTRNVDLQRIAQNRCQQQNCKKPPESCMIIFFSYPSVHDRTSVCLGGRTVQSPKVRSHCSGWKGAIPLQWKKVISPK